MQVDLNKLEELRNDIRNLAIKAEYRNPEVSYDLHKLADKAQEMVMEVIRADAKKTKKALEYFGVSNIAS